LSGNKTVIIAGASGLTGAYCLKYLLEREEIEKVISIGRHRSNIQHPKLEHRIVNFDRLSEDLKDVKADWVFSCLGTTRHKAGSKAGFRKVDFTYVVELGKIMLKNGAEKYLLISSVTAKAKGIFFYNKIKGQTEEALQNLNYSELIIFRPSFLIGKRDEQRFGEKIGKSTFTVLTPLMIGPIKKYRPIAARIVAKAMVVAAVQYNAPVTIYPTKSIRELAKI
jgi:uncharacterized protein YbjT (DUF2867 family)